MNSSFGPLIMHFLAKEDAFWGFLDFFFQVSYFVVVLSNFYSRIHPCFSWKLFFTSQIQYFLIVVSSKTNLKLEKLEKLVENWRNLQKKLEKLVDGTMKE